MKAYDGTSDLFNYLESFRFLMLLQGTLDALMCKTFPATFRKVVRFWYTQLQSGLILSFKKFGQNFIAQF